VAVRYVQRVRNPNIKREWLTAKEAAALLRLTLPTVRRACNRGVLEGAELLGQGWVIPRASLEAARATLRVELSKQTLKGHRRQRRQPLLRGRGAGTA
jgi:excisionase family DNA binding protein